MHKIVLKKKKKLYFQRLHLLKFNLMLVHPKKKFFLPYLLYFILVFRGGGGIEDKELKSFGTKAAFERILKKNL